MNFKTEKDITNNIFSTTITFTSFGTQDMIAEDEITLIQDFGSPSIDIGGSFTGKLKYDATTKKVIIDELEGEDITFILNSRKMPIDEKFVATYSKNAKLIDTTKISTTGTLTNARLVAEAECLLFKTEIQKRLVEAMTEFRLASSSFEAFSPESFEA